MGDESALASINRTLARLMRRSGSRAAFARQAAAAKVSLTQPAYTLLRIMIDTGPLPMGELARLAHMDVGMATRQVNALVDDGLVAREPDASDGRVTLAKATTKGARAAGAIQDIRMRHLERSLADWSPRDLRTLDRLLTRFQADTEVTPFDEP